MKILLPFLCALILVSFRQDVARLQGAYRTVFEKKYEQQTYQLVFADSVFRKVMPDAVMYKGKIKYEKFKAVLRCHAGDAPIEIDKRDFGKDSMKFTIRSKDDFSKTTARGLLVRVP